MCRHPDKLGFHAGIELEAGRELPAAGHRGVGGGERSSLKTAPKTWYGWGGGWKEEGPRYREQDENVLLTERRFETNF